jgi:hypothetical protein
MCSVSKPKQQAAPPPPTTETVDPSGNIAANRDADRRRRRFAMSRMNTQAGGAMQGESAGTAKKKLGE